MNRKVNRLGVTSEACESRILLSASDLPAATLTSNEVPSSDLPGGDLPGGNLSASDSAVSDLSPESRPIVGDATVSNSATLANPVVADELSEDDPEVVGEELTPADLTLPQETVNTAQASRAPTLEREVPSIEQTLTEEVAITSSTADVSVGFADRLLDLLGETQSLGPQEFFAPGSSTRQMFTEATRQANAAASEIFLLNLGSFQRFNNVLQANSTSTDTALSDGNGARDPSETVPGLVETDDGESADTVLDEALIDDVAFEDDIGGTLPVQTGVSQQ